MLKVRTLSLGDETFYGTKKVSVRGKSLHTPVKAVNFKNLRKDIEINHARFLGEIYKTFDEKKIKALVGDEENQITFNAGLNSATRMAEYFEIEHLLFIPSLTYLNPNENELTFIIATQKQYSDFYVVPTVAGLSKLLKAGHSIQDYIALIEYYLNLLEGYPKKSVMGTLPLNIPYQYIEGLVAMYLDRGVEAFCIDIGGRVALSLTQQIAEVQRFLLKNEIEAFVHATNVNIGRAKKRSNIITAKDVLSFGMGFDSIGDNHVGGGTRDAPPVVDLNLRLFDKDGYGYHKIHSMGEIEDIYPEDSRVKPEHLMDDSLSRRKKAQATFNYEQIGMETNRLTKVIDEGGVDSYVRNKTHVDNDSFKAIAKVRADMSQTRLEEFLR